MIITGESLSIYDVFDIAVNRISVTLDPNNLDRAHRTYERVQQWGSARYPIYGVNTGFGELAHIIIPPEKKTELQRNLLRSHAAASGDPFADDIVRAIMAVRLNCFMKGYSGVSSRALEVMATLLNYGLHPIIPQKGSLGASGDLAPLAHMALVLIGEGELRVNGKIYQTQNIYDNRNIEPIELGYKEALALINGTSAMTGVICLALVKAIDLLKLAVFASADAIQCLEASTRAFDHRSHVLKNHEGQIQIAAALRTLLEGSQLTREHPEIMRLIHERTADSKTVIDLNIFLQNAYTLRCIPQILGPILDAISFCRRLTEEEVNSCNDNPLFFDRPEDSFHGGHFHGQYIGMASDFLNIALTEIGVLAERQLNRLLDPYVNGSLPAFLASGEVGLFCGYEGAQYLATSVASENLDLCAPASVKSIPSNGQNQDVVSMGLIAARKSLEISENVSSILAVLIGACHQAVHMIGIDRFSPLVRQFHETIAPDFPLYHDEQPIASVIERWKTLLRSDRVRHFLNSCVSFKDLDDMRSSQS